MGAFAELLRKIGRRLEPLFQPDAERRRQRDEKLMRLVVEQQGVARDTAARLEQHVDASARLAARVEALERTHLPELRAAVKGVRAAVGRQERVLKRSRFADQLLLQQQSVMRRLDRLASTDRPILIGPWTGEIGFELLYWAPFVRWVVATYELAPSRITLMSRGGTAAWYGSLGSSYVDALHVVDVGTYRGRTTERKKQRLVSAFDRDLIRRAQARIGTRPALLHPGLMYHLFLPYWKRQASLRRVLDHTRFARIEADGSPMPPGLPHDYVAARFYFSSCFPDTPRNREFIATTVASLAERMHVVLLDPGERVDDHEGAAIAPGERIHRLALAPETNLAVQTAVIAGARAFVGTYGGFAYLAPLCGVPAAAFYADRNFYAYHLEVAHHALAAVNGGALEAIDVSNASLLSSALRLAEAATQARK
jgi:hypothetical protein